jgi:hypothetical protein
MIPPWVAAWIDRDEQFSLRTILTMMNEHQRLSQRSKQPLEMDLGTIEWS